MKPRVGISRCLRGDEVRYDGGSKLAPTVLEQLGPHVEWVAVCPEVDIGMGTPREPVVLVAEAARTRMLGLTTRRDWTDAMASYATHRVAELEAAGIAGYVFKSRSPSCGIHDGLFARTLIAALPDLPVAEEQELESVDAAREFLERIRRYEARSTKYKVPRT